MYSYLYIVIKDKMSFAVLSKQVKGIVVCEILKLQYTVSNGLRMYKELSKKEKETYEEYLKK